MLTDTYNARSDNFVSYGLLAAYAVGLLTIIITAITFPVHQDEAVYMHAAGQMLAGKRLYVDVVDIKPPGIHVLMAMTGAKNIISARVMSFVMTATGSIVLMHIVGYITKSKYTQLAVSTIFVLSIVAFNGQFALPDTGQLFFTIIGLYAVFRYKATRHWVWACAAGVSVGLALCFKQTSLIIIAGYFSYLVADRKRGGHEGILWYLTGIVIVLFMVGGYMYSIGVVDALYTHTINYIVQYYIPTSVPQVWDIFKLFIPTTPLWVYILFTSIFQKTKQMDIIITLSLLTIGTVVVRPYHHYILLGLPFVAILAGMQTRRSTAPIVIIICWLVILNAATAIDGILAHHDRRIVKPFPQTQKLRWRNIAHTPGGIACDDRRRILFVTNPSLNDVDMHTVDGIHTFS